MPTQANFEMIRDAHVEVRDIIDFDVNKLGNRVKRHQAEVSINGGQFTHRFPHTSRVSKHLELMAPKDLAERMSGGSFFFVEGALSDWRDGLYDGFMHTDEAIGHLMKTIGVTHQSELALHLRTRNVGNSTQVRRSDDRSEFQLRRLWDKSEIVCPNYSDGGVFSSQLSFQWNPYTHHVQTAFDLVRQICTNGAVGLTSLVNMRVPVINNWEAHLDIAATQIQRKVGSIVKSRVDMLATNRADINTLTLLAKHARDRSQVKGIDLSLADRLATIQHIADPARHLSNTYQGRVFGDSAISARLPGHLSMFDAWNIATEMRTHYDAADNSSNHALDKIANGLMFDAQPVRHEWVSSHVTDKECAFSNPDQAFFGQMM